MNATDCSVCVILPLYRNAKTIGALLERLDANLGNHNLSIVGVDDASPDASGEVLVSAAKEMQIPCQLLTNTRNRGQQESIWIGLEHASADILVVMDADLQDPPNVAAELVARLEDEHISLVVACRRQDAFWSSDLITSYVFKRLLFWAIGSKVPVEIGGFYAMRSNVMEKLRSRPDVDPSLLPLYLVHRVPTTFCYYERKSRMSGKSGYTFRSRLRFAWRVWKNIDTLR